MDRTERFYRIDALLQGNRAVSLERMLDVLQVSRATFKRDLEYLRDRLGSPIVWDRELRGYRYERPPGETTQALPGLWFNAQEAHALLMMQAMLSNLQPTLLKAQIEPLKARLRALIETGQHPAEDVERRFRLLTTGQRVVADGHFEVVATALLSRRQLALRYYVRARDERSERLVSPQVLVHYRGNWYLVAWCHLRRDLRSFALDSIEEAHLVQTKAREVPASQVDAFIGQGYGIFSGAKVQWATLRFTAERSRWVARETWHPRQEQTWLPDGRLELRVPFTDLRELAMDVMRHGAQVEILEPQGLRDTVAQEHRDAAGLYGHTVV
ncbi:MAG: helix-turn-helix transcriptional regulator [Fimbriimonadaceae bacterium]